MKVEVKVQIDCRADTGWDVIQDTAVAKKTNLSSSFRPHKSVLLSPYFLIGATKYRSLLRSSLHLPSLQVLPYINPQICHQVSAETIKWTKLEKKRDLC